MTNNLFVDLEEAFNKVGSSMYSDDFCCKLLAWVYIFGGGNEAVTQNKGMFGAIQVAQRRLNLLGGQVPNPNLLPLFQKYAQEAEYHEKGLKEALWVNSEVNKRYGISPYRFEPRTKTPVNEVFYTRSPERNSADR